MLQEPVKPVIEDKPSSDDSINAIKSKEEQPPSEEPEWLIPRKKEEDVDSHGTHQSLFSTTTTTGPVTKAPLIVDMTQTGTAPDTAQDTTPQITELLLPSEFTSSTQPVHKGRPLIEEIEETTTDNPPMLSSPTGSSNFFITESHVTKAASFHSKPPESSPTVFGGEWAHRTKPLIEEIGDDDTTKTCTEKMKIEVIEDLEDADSCEITSQHTAKDHLPCTSSENEKGTISTGQVISEEQRDEITKLAEKAGSTLDPVTVDQDLLQTLRQKYQ